MFNYQRMYDVWLFCKTLMEKELEYDTYWPYYHIAHGLQFALDIKNLKVGVRGQQHSSAIIPIYIHKYVHGINANTCI